eukprot:scaffold937_cov502-Prasinococcus_capsulatus_cf.AAC.1
MVSALYARTVAQQTSSLCWHLRQFSCASEGVGVIMMMEAMLGASSPPAKGARSGRRSALARLAEIRSLLPSDARHPRG